MADVKISALPASTTPLAGTEVLPIVQSGSTRQVSVANLTAGRTQTSNGIVQGTAGTGYNFTANTPAAGMTSQLLNWYEEGTYTATITCSGSGTVTLSAGASTLAYTRIGRQVTVTGYISVNSVSSPVGNFAINLPFAIGNLGGVSGSIGGSIVVNGVNAANVADFVFVGFESGTSISVFLGDATGVQSDSAQELKTGSEIYMSVTYFTA